MTLDQILRAERALNQVRASLSPLIDHGLRSELADASYLLAEVRHFANCTTYHDQLVLDEEHVNTQREESRERLVRACTPES